MARDLPSCGPAVKRGAPDPTLPDVLDLTPVSEIAQRRRFSVSQVARIPPATRGTSIADHRGMLRTFSLFVLASLAACGGGNGNLLGGDPVGRWRQLPNLADDDPPPPVEERHILEFLADGTMVEIDGPGDEEFGTWEIDGDELVMIQDGETQAFRMPYRADSDTFVFGALTPVGSTNRGIGTWTATVDDFSTEEAGDALTVTLDIRPDNTATVDYDFTGSREDETYEGTWVSEGDDFRVIVMPEENVTINMMSTFVDGVMGTPYERL
jgi:hypothetical protein